jgi:hypothetical protein
MEGVRNAINSQNSILTFKKTHTHRSGIKEGQKRDRVEPPTQHFGVIPEQLLAAIVIPLPFQN